MNFNEFLNKLDEGKKSKPELILKWDFKHLVNHLEKRMDEYGESWDTAWENGFEQYAREGLPDYDEYYGEDKSEKIYDSEMNELIKRVKKAIRNDGYKIKR